MVYDEFYSGSGEQFYEYQFFAETERFNNTDTCTAISECASLANNYGDPFFIVEYLCAEEQWACSTYTFNENNPTYFNVSNPDITAAYGYSTPLPVD